MGAILWGLLSAVPGLLGQFLGYQTAKVNSSLEGFRTAAGVDQQAYQSWLSATVEITRMKLAANGWWGAKVIIMAAGLPASAHMGSIFMDSMPFPFVWWGDWFFTVQTHVIGSWGIPKPPAPYDDYQAKIVLSFFIIMPAMPIVSAVSQWLGRK